MDKGMWIDAEIIRTVICAVVLMTEGIRDLRRKEISVLSCIVTALIGFFIRIYWRDLSWWGLIGCIAPGGILLLLSLVSRESIGYGDGLILCAIGILLGGAETVTLFCHALFMCGIFSGFLFFFRKAGAKKRIPFVVFMLPSYGIMTLVEVLAG